MQSTAPSPALSTNDNNPFVLKEGGGGGLVGIPYYYYCFLLFLELWIRIQIFIQQHTERHESWGMEDEIQSTQTLSRIGNNNARRRSKDSTKIGQQKEQYQDEDEEDGEEKTGTGTGTTSTSVGVGVNVASDQGGRLRSWYSSRIHRVSRSAGGKDRHSKVVTAKGLRDRRVRLSVSTAIQFYDLQDRLGYDQPSKAVEWLIKAASDAISELPPLDNKFPGTPKQPSDEKRPGFDAAEMELDNNDNININNSFHQHQQQQQQQQQQHISLTKSACSSTSETSKGSSVLSLSRSEIRVKARERARERAAKDKEKEIKLVGVQQQQQKDHDQSSSSHNLIASDQHQSSHNSSFTELLTGANNNSSHHHHSPTHHNHFLLKTTTTPMDYFNPGLFSSSRIAHFSSGFPAQSSSTLFGIAPPQHAIQIQHQQQPFTVPGHHHQHHHELQHFSFLPDHLISDAAVAVTGSDYNLNFSISSGLAAGGGCGYSNSNRGTLQSNSSQSPHPMPQNNNNLQRFSTDGPNMSFFIGNNVAAAAAATTENHQHQHQFPDGCDGRLQLCYGDGAKGKGKS